MSWSLWNDEDYRTLPFRERMVYRGGVYWLRAAFILWVLRGKPKRRRSR